MASNSKKSTSRLTSDELVFRGIKSIVRAGRVWAGTMTRLESEIRSSDLSTEERAVMPKSPSALRVVVNRVVNRLRNRGISVKFGRKTDHSRTRFVRFAR
jgi:hypothetical protein